MGESVLRDKSYAFAIEIVKLAQVLQKNSREYDLSRQVLRSGTAIGALIFEAQFGQSKADFIHKLTIAMKEANETKYWLNLLKDNGFIEEIAFQALIGP
jgi:four helix bundle protein